MCVVVCNGVSIGDSSHATMCEMGGKFDGKGCLRNLIFEQVTPPFGQDALRDGCTSRQLESEWYINVGKQISKHIAKVT